MMSNDCARAAPPKPPSAKLNMKTITTARRIKSLLFVPNSAWLPCEFIALPQKALQSNTSPEDSAIRACHQTRAAPSGLPRLFGGVMLAAWRPWQHPTSVGNLSNPVPQMAKNRDRHIPRRTVVFAGFLPVVFLSTALLAFPRAQSQSPAQSNSQNEPTPQANSAAVLPRGKKLCLKDGTFQLVRSYERKGDRVRYYSVERAGWEEIPEAMVDWDATKKAETESAKEQEALRAKVRTQEAAERIMPLDIDASLEIARGVFLPPGEGVFVLEGDYVRPL